MFHAWWEHSNSMEILLEAREEELRQALRDDHPELDVVIDDRISWSWDRKARGRTRADTRAAFRDQQDPFRSPLGALLPRVSRRPDGGGG